MTAAGLIDALPPPAEGAQIDRDRSARIGIASRGRLAEALVPRFRRDHRIEPLPPDDEVEVAPRVAMDALDQLDLVLLIGDDWDRAQRERWNALCLDAGVPLLPVQLEPGAAIVGPCVRPGEPGCLLCMDGRRLRARHDAVDYLKVREHSERALAAMGAAWLTSFASGILGELVSDQLARAVRGDLAGTRPAFIRLTLDGLRVTVHRFLPDPLCERCGRLPDDSREAATLALVSRRKVSPSGYRARTLHAEKARLFDLYVDPQAGLIRGVLKE